MSDKPTNRHQFKIRVYYEDTDAGGIVYYANYLRYAERARTELMRDLGLEISQLMLKAGVILAVRYCSVNYNRSAVLDDNLIVETEFVRVGGASLEAHQIIRRHDVNLVSINIKLGCMTLAGNAARLPESIREKLTKYFVTNKS